MQNDFLVQTSSLYAAICDQGSPAWQAGFMTRIWADAGSQAEQQGLAPEMQLFVFNDLLTAMAREGQLLPWTLLFDGVFRVSVELGEDVPMATGDLGSPVATADLVCPTGRLVVACLGRLGETCPPVIQLDPGVYRVTLKRDETQEFEHMLLDAPQAYPAGQGPDWHLTLSRR